MRTLARRTVVLDAVVDDGGDRPVGLADLENETGAGVDDIGRAVVGVAEGAKQRRGQREDGGEREDARGAQIELVLPGFTPEPLDGAAREEPAGTLERR